jgi:lipoate-protein ligase A
MKWRLIITPDLQPRLNMALDEVLLDSVRAQHPTLRFYSWSPPGISLGHFQQIPAEAFTEWQQRGFVLVRRLTGGGAIAHQNDLTYSIIIANLAELGLSQHTELYDLAHSAFVLALRTLGVTAQIRGGGHARRSNLISHPASLIPHPSSVFFCSERKSAQDLVCSGKKMLGSAQRRRGEAILQHGSLLLSKSAAGEDLLSVSEAAGRAVSFEELSRLLRDAFADRVKAALTDAQFTPDEWSEAQCMAQEKYSQVWKLGERSCPA